MYIHIVFFKWERSNLLASSRQSISAHQSISQQSHNLDGWMKTCAVCLSGDRSHSKQTSFIGWSNNHLNHLHFKMSLEPEETATCAADNSLTAQLIYISECHLKRNNN